MSSQSLSSRREQFLQHDQARLDHLALRDSLLTQPQRTAAELEKLAADGAQQFNANGNTEQLLAWVASKFGYRTAVACSMADTVLPHVVAQHLPWVDTLFLETGYHFAETIGTRDAAQASMELTIVDVLPAQTVAQQDAEFGPELHQRDPALCCQLRKVDPLTKVLGGYEVWITGVRRDESPLRVDTPFVTWDAKNQLVKVNPLAAWTFEELASYSEQHNLISNPLIAEGYPSIGCAPCTRKVAPGDDPRAGRWSGFNKSECGLHT